MFQYLQTATTTLLIGGIVVLFVGCGGSGQSSPPPPPPPSQPPVAAAPQNANVAAQREDKKKNKKSKRGNRRRNRRDELAINADTYVIKEEAPPGPQFKIIQTTEADNQKIAFYIAAPESGNDSSTFSIVSQPGNSLGTRNPDFRLPDGFTALEKQGFSEEGMPLRILGEADGVEMVFVPAGSFIMGEDEQSKDVEPKHTVFVNAFYVDLHEVTVGAYRSHIATQKEKGKLIRDKPINFNDDENHAAVGLNWGQAKRYAKAMGKDLPTEAEWEKAARGTKGFQHPWGNSRPIWRSPRNGSQIGSVTFYKSDRSPSGAFDMAGNAKEWCLDWYSPTTYANAVKKDETPQNPTGPKSGSRKKMRVVRGANSDWFIWHREGLPMGEKNPRVGFRSVLRVTIPSETTSDE